MPHISEEFYCTKDGGGCGGYILLRINVGLNGVVKIVCPNCKHEHQRNIVNGVIMESGRFNGTPTEEIIPTMAAFSKTPRTELLKKKSKTSIGSDVRDAVVVEEKEDPDKVVAKNFIRQSWHERFAHKLAGKLGLFNFI